MLGLRGWTAEKFVAQGLNLLILRLTLDPAQLIDISNIDPNPGTALANPASGKVKLWSYSPEPP